MDYRIKLILQEIDSNDTVLDIGCVHHSAEVANTAKWLHKYLYGKAKYVLGMDILECEVEKLRNSGYNVIVADAENFKLDQKFDVIIAGELIEHLSNPGKFLERCKDHLKDKGKLILTTPNAWCILNLISVIFKGFPPLNVEHTCWYDKKTVAQLLDRYGFKIDKFDFVKPPRGARGWLLAHMLYNLGFKQLGGVGLFVVCRRESDTHE